MYVCVCETTTDLLYYNFYANSEKFNEIFLSISLFRNFLQLAR